jgi:hypothetical protein
MSSVFSRVALAALHWTIESIKLTKDKHSLISPFKLTVAGTHFETTTAWGGVVVSPPSSRRPIKKAKSFDPTSKWPSWPINFKPQAYIQLYERIGYMLS